MIPFVLDESFLPPDDLYHCKDPNSTFQTTVSISCDPSTYLWALEELIPEQPPTMCGGPDFVISGDDLSNIQDWFEPCVHWAMIYGNLAPATPVPTDAVETTDGTFTTCASQPSWRCRKRLTFMYSPRRRVQHGSP